MVQNYLQSSLVHELEQGIRYFITCPWCVGGRGTCPPRTIVASPNCIPRRLRRQPSLRIELFREAAKGRGLWKWKRESVLGPGAFGIVFLENEEHQGQPRAVKVIRRHDGVGTGCSQGLLPLISLMDVSARHHESRVSGRWSTPHLLWEGAGLRYAGRSK